MNYKGVIFDLDGTLVNSIEDLTESMNSILVLNKFPTHNIINYKQFVGNGMRTLIIRALPEKHRNSETIDKCFDEMMEIYEENCTTKSKPYEEIQELLAELTKRNIKIAVLSNKIDSLTKKIVTLLFPDIHFEYVMGFTTEETKKPNPQNALQICSNIGFAPCEMLYVGDSGTDMQTGKNAKMVAVGALWGYRTAKELHDNGAKHLLKHPLELLTLFCK